MKAKTIGFEMILALTAILILALPASAAATQSPFQGSAYLTGFVDGGTCQLTAPMEICRGLTVVFTFDVDDARFAGPATTVINSNFHLDPYAGPQWGTLLLANAGGSWEGTYTGVRNDDGSAYLSGLAHGRGDYKGLKAHFSAVRLSGNMFDPFQVTGSILDPHGQ
jgi:hypothetical protein